MVVKIYARYMLGRCAHGCERDKGKNIQLIDDLRSQEFDDAADMIERLMAENAKLREALKPFAEEAKAWIDVGDDSQTLFDSDLTIRDVRRAAKLLDAVDSGSVAL